jgi:hypothetical protein
MIAGDWAAFRVALMSHGADSEGANLDLGRFSQPDLEIGGRSPAGISIISSYNGRSNLYCASAVVSARFSGSPSSPLIFDFDISSAMNCRSGLLFLRVVFLAQQKPINADLIYSSTAPPVSKYDSLLHP